MSPNEAMAEAARIRADLARNQAKRDGSLRQDEEGRALAEQIKTNHQI